MSLVINGEAQERRDHRLCGPVDVFYHAANTDIRKHHLDYQLRLEFDAWCSRWKNTLETTLDGTISLDKRKLGVNADGITEFSYEQTETGKMFMSFIAGVYFPVLLAKKDTHADFECWVRAGGFNLAWLIREVGGEYRNYWARLMYIAFCGGRSLYGSAHDLGEDPMAPFRFNKYPIAANPYAGKKGLRLR